MAKNNKNLIVGLDIGTSSVKTIIALINEDNEIDFLGKGSAKSLGMKRGMVIDIHSTVQSIKKSVEEAELLAEEEIKSVYASISGNHIQSYDANGRAAISDNKEVTQDDLSSVEESAKAITLSNEQEILHVLPNHLIFAPAEFKKFVRSFISGSIAQFFKTVLPFAKHAAIIKFSVAPTLILGNFIRLPLSLPLVLAKMYPSLIL